MKQRGSLGIPLAIIVAGFIIAGAIFISNTKSTRSPKSPSDTPQQALGEQTKENQGQPESQGKPGNQSTYKVSVDDDPVFGDENAPVTLIEFSDFQCPFCGRWFSEVEPVLKSDYIDKGQVKLVYRDFAFLGPESNQAGEAAECADEQGKFWQYHDKLFESQSGENRGAFAKEKLKAFAADLGLDTGKFNECLDSGKYEQEVKDDTLAGRAASVTGTPSVFIGRSSDSGEIEGVKIVGAQPPPIFTSVIDELLNQ